jgi:hypothetical protein
MRALRVRIKLRNELNHEPSAAEIREYSMGGKGDEILHKEVSAAFRAGEEVCSRHVLLSISSHRE